MEKITSAATAQTGPTFPFTTIVGQQRLQLTLILTALSPKIDGVVIRGEKGIAKITTVRALTPFLSESLVNLPPDATEDRVIDSIGVETILTTGHAQFNPGLLNATDGDILYVGEINLLPDHFVNSVLDAAATGHIVVERDGISHPATSKFVLVGTIDPEEGELRPQLLDRFGLIIGITTSKDPTVRVEIVAHRLDFDADPESFVTRFVADDTALHARIGHARVLLGDVELTLSILGQIATVCAAFNVDDMRAGIVVARTTRAHAAWRVAGDESAQPEPCNPIKITAEDIKVATKMALPHRRRRDPFDEPGLDQKQLDDTLQNTEEWFRDGQNQPESGSGTSGQPEVKSEPVSQFDSDSEPQEPRQSGSAGSEGGRAAKGAPFRRS